MQQTDSGNIGHHETLPLAELNNYHRNPRRGDVAAIKGSIIANGVFRPIIVNRGTYTGKENQILAGNHTVKAIRELAEENPQDTRWQQVEVWMVDVDDDRASRIVLADNRTADLGDYDEQVLAELLNDMGDDLDGTGYVEDDLEELEELIEQQISAGDTQQESAVSEAEANATLSERFGVPPFTVINTTRGGWQARKKAWMAKGIASQEGRAESLIYTDAVNLYRNWYEVKNAALKETPGLKDKQIEEKYAGQLLPLNAGQGTSIFDPALAELLLTWFSTTGDEILDPWAGGSVRGIVSATLGRDYVGHELRQEQVDANEVQWDDYNGETIPGD